MLFLSNEQQTLNFDLYMLLGFLLLVGFVFFFLRLSVLALPGLNLVDWSQLKVRIIFLPALTM